MVPRERVKREYRALRLDQWSGGKSVAAPATVSGTPPARPLTSAAMWRVTEASGPREDRAGRMGQA